MLYLKDTVIHQRVLRAKFTEDEITSMLEAAILRKAGIPKGTPVICDVKAFYRAEDRVGTAGTQTNVEVTVIIPVTE